MKKILKLSVCMFIMMLFLCGGKAFADVGENTPNVPVLVSGLTPIKYKNGGWVNVSEPWYNDSEWYDYESGIWANAQLSDGTKYVWIPRFTYKIENGEVSIKWSDNKEDDISNGYLRHPAFYFGEYLGGDTSENSNFVERNGTRNEITGFWLQKEAIENNTDALTAFENALTFKANSGLPQSGTYTHMTKASEWGALAYLTAAKGDTDSKMTTNNKTGIELGNSVEYVAGIKGSPESGMSLLDSNYKKYRDRLDNGLSQYYGYALTETIQKASQAGMLAEDSFLLRGGNLGVLGYTSGNGRNGASYRTAIVVLQEELTDAIAFFDTETSVISGDYLILGVDFYVGESWKFPENPEDFFTKSSSMENKKPVDIECIYEGSSTWKQSELNAQVLKLVKPDMSIAEVGSINTSTVYPSGKYTLVIRVGGYIGETPVFVPMNNADVKIVANEINLKNSSGDLIKIGRILNNKVRLNIYGESGSTAVTKVVLKSVPDKIDYELDEELNLNGGIIVPYLGNLAGEEISISMNNIVNKNITGTSGEHKVELVYDGMSVVQEEGNEYIINVSDTKQVEIIGEVKVGNNKLNLQLAYGPGKYSREENSTNKSLTAYEELNGYYFVNWSSDSEIIKAADSHDYNTTFTIPAKSASLDKDVVTFTANYVAPSRVEISNQKTEFIVDEDFSLGADAILKAIYNKNGSEVEKKLKLKDVTITLKDKNNNECSQDKLQNGEYTVTLEYVGKQTTYNIEVVNKKYNLSVYLGNSDYGEITGDIKSLNGNVKDTILLNSETGSAYKAVSYGNNVTLKATSKTGYAFSKWIIEGKDDLLSAEALNNSEITFAMPTNDISVTAEYVRVYTVKFKIKDGQSVCGSLEGTVEQFIVSGGSTTEVTASANSGYAFIKWLNKDGSLYSVDNSLTILNVTQDEEYTAVFDNMWTVGFYNEGSLFKEISVVNGSSGYISDIPEKQGYVFVNWDKDLSCIESNTTTNAVFVPRIKIEEKSNAAVGMIDAQITGTKITEGTLQYIISPSETNPTESIFSYVIDDVFTEIDGEWMAEGVYFRNPSVDVNNDSSEVLVISSANSSESLEFEYLLSAGDSSQLGITINGERVVSPSNNIESEIDSEWSKFSGEVDVIDGKIKIGISYSQGSPENASGTHDFAAIKNLKITKYWQVIPNSYHLLIPTEYGVNYIHVKGTGSDDNVIYKAVSDAFNAQSEE